MKSQVWSDGSASIPSMSIINDSSEPRQVNSDDFLLGNGSDNLIETITKDATSIDDQLKRKLKVSSLFFHFYIHVFLGWLLILVISMKGQDIILILGFVDGNLVGQSQGIGTFDLGSQNNLVDDLLWWYFNFI